MAATASRALTSHSPQFGIPLTPGGSFVILCKLTIMAICTDIEPLVAALLRAATKISLVFRLEATCVGGRLALFET